MNGRESRKNFSTVSIPHLRSALLVLIKYGGNDGMLNGDKLIVSLDSPPVSLDEDLLKAANWKPTHEDKLTWYVCAS